ncbi:hypothetical protein Bca101_009837 [Brassica carinata]
MTRLDFSGRRSSRWNVTPVDLGLVAEVPDSPMVAWNENMNSESSLFPSAFVGGRVKPCLFSDDPFSSPISSWERTLGTDDEEAPMAPLKQRRSYLLDDGPCSRVCGEDLTEIRNRYAIPPSRAPDGRVDEVAIYEAYLEAGVRSGVPSLVAENFDAHTGARELRGFHISVHEVLYSYCFAPLANKPGFYFLPVMVLLWSGSPREVPEEIILSEITGTTDTCIPPRVLCWEAVVKLVMEIPLQFRWVSFLVSKEALRHSRIWGKVFLLLVFVFAMLSTSHSLTFPRECCGASFICCLPELPRGEGEEKAFFLQSYTKLDRAAASVSVDAKAGVDYSLSKDIHQKLLAEVFSLRGQVQDMMAHIDRLIQQVRVATRWKLMKEWLEERTGCWNPGEEYR